MSDDLWTSADICEALQVHRQKLTVWRKEADPDDPFPCTKIKGVYQHDPVEVKEWLLRNGKVIRDGDPEPDPPDEGPIFRTRKDVANFFNVNTRTVGAWIEDPSFPGKAGGPNQRNAHYSAKAIARWLKNTGKTTPIPPGLLAEKTSGIDDEERVPARYLDGDPKSEWTRHRAEKTKIEVDKLRGELIAADEAVSFFRRVNGYAVTMLKGLPSRIQAALPSDTSEPVRNSVDRAAREVVTECQELMVELIEGDKDEQE